MRELDRANYTNNAYLRGLTNRMSIDVADPNKNITFNIRLLNNKTARMYVTVLDSGTYHVDRHYDFEINLESAKQILKMSNIDESIQDYIYTIEYQDSRCMVVQYEKLPDGRKRIITQTWLESPSQLNWFSDQLQVVQPPVVIFDNSNMILNHKYKVYASSQILTQEDSLISVFIVEFNGESRPYYILPTDRFGEVLFEIFISPKYFTGIEVEELPLKIIAVDNEGHKATTEIQIKPNQGTVYQPKIISPVVGQNLSITGFEIVGSPFETSPIAFDPKHVSTDYKITKDFNGSQIIWEYSTDKAEELTSYTVSFDEDSSLLEWDTNYYLWIRYKDKRLGYSDWSEYVQLTLQEDVIIDVDPPILYGGSYLGLIGYSYTWKIKSKTNTGNHIDHFVVKLRGIENSEIELKPTQQEGDYFIAEFPLEITSDLQDDSYYIDVVAVDDNGNYSLFTTQEIIVISPNVIKDDIFYVTQGEAVTINNSQLMINDKIDPAYKVKNITYSNAINGQLTPVSNGVIFKSINLAYLPAGFDYTVEDSCGGKVTAHVTVKVTRLPDTTGFILSKKEREDYISMFNPLSSSPKSLFDYQVNRQYIYNTTSGTWNLTDKTLQQEFGFPRTVTCKQTGKIYNITQYDVTKIQ